MPSGALAACSNESVAGTGQSPPGRLFNGMIAPVKARPRCNAQKVSVLDLSCRIEFRLSFSSSTSASVAGSGIRCTYPAAAPLAGRCHAGWSLLRTEGLPPLQGENNCADDPGNSATKQGYGCELPAMVREWRELWAERAAAISANASFGVVTLASGGSEGHDATMAGLRWSQTANCEPLSLPLCAASVPPPSSPARPLSTRTCPPACRATPAPSRPPPQPP